MSHIGVRILADWLADPTFGVDALTAVLPLDPGDVRPRAVHIYNDTRDAVAARRRVTEQDLKENVVELPAILVMLHDVSYDDGVPAATAEGGEIVTGTLTATLFLINRDKDSVKAATENMYLVRAFRNSLLLFNKATVDRRRRLGVQLEPSTATAAADVGEVPEDLLMPDAQLLTYPITESVAISG